MYLTALTAKTHSSPAAFPKALSACPQLNMVRGLAIRRIVCISYKEIAEH